MCPWLKNSNNFQDFFEDLTTLAFFLPRILSLKCNEFPNKADPPVLTDKSKSVLVQPEVSAVSEPDQCTFSSGQH